MPTNIRINDNKNTQSKKQRICTNGLQILFEMIRSSLRIILTTFSKISERKYCC